MKRILFMLALTSLVIAGCKKYPGDSYDFSNSLDKYIEIKTKTALTGKHPGGTVSFTIQSREAWTEDVIFNYKFNGIAGHDTLKLEKTSRVTPIVIPADILGVDVSKTVKFELIDAATKTTAKPISIGRFGQTLEFVNVTIVP
jgi:hypothetical protein